MSHIKVINIMLIFFYKLKCLSETNKHLKEQLESSYSISEKLCYDARYPTKIYEIHLYIIIDSKDDDRYFKDDPQDNINYIRMSIGISDEYRINRFIKELKKNNETNHRITFYYSNKRTKLIKFIKSFIRKLEENEIDKVDLKYNCDKNDINFYEYGVYYMEQDNGNIIILSKKSPEEGSFYIEKITINNGYLTYLLGYYEKIYSRNIKDTNRKTLFKEYFLNYKLLLADVNSLFERGQSFNEFLNLKEEVKPRLCSFKKKSTNSIPDMIYLNILFYFLKDSDFLENMVVKSLSNYKPKRYSTYKKILKQLKIEISDPSQILDLLTETSSISDIEKNENVDSVDIICHRIRTMNMKNCIERFSLILLYFFDYMKDIEKVEVDELLSIVNDIIISEDCKKHNLKVLRRLIQLLSYIFNKTSFCFYFDLFSEREEIHLQKLI